jgi:D-3-phosphoglycerate dehydrogenase
LDSHIVHVKSLDELYANCDIITVHVPLLDSTRKMINLESISKMKDGVVILNFARDLLVDDDAMEAALKSGKVKKYITDFPNARTAGMDGVIAIPHLGASTEESEDNCAKMAVLQVMDYLENGNIINSVNYPNCDMGVCTKAARITILHKNIPNTLGQFTAVLAKENINISDLINRSKGEFAYTMLDLDEAPTEDAIECLKKVEGVVRVRVIR